MPATLPVPIAFTLPTGRRPVPAQRITFSAVADDVRRDRCDIVLEDFQDFQDFVRTVRPDGGTEG
ncbi:hypothetical protein ACFVHW_10630 [Streptomyces sp. NPDC127110]|uniref:hypothetical protein n=1 Tax=Streptomyces sp. NPDC127110 TaxID=3345362 RepID=UPI00362EE08C